MAKSNIVEINGYHINKVGAKKMGKKDFLSTHANYDFDVEAFWDKHCGSTKKTASLEKD